MGTARQPLPALACPWAGLFPERTFQPRSRCAAPRHCTDPARTHPTPGLCRCGTRVPPTSVRRLWRATTASCWHCVSKGKCAHACLPWPQRPRGARDGRPRAATPWARSSSPHVSLSGCVCPSCGASSPSSRPGGTRTLPFRRCTFMTCSPSPGVPRAEDRAGVGAQ